MLIGLLLPLMENERYLQEVSRRSQGDQEATLPLILVNMEKWKYITIYKKAIILGYCKVGNYLILLAFY